MWDLKICLLMIGLFLIPALGYGQSSREINFIWKAAESGNKKFEKAVMLVPIKFKSDTTTYFLQFDTGAAFSYLYSYRLNWKVSNDQLLETSLGKIAFKNNKSINATNAKNAVIGTLGADFLLDKTVIINYPRQQIKIGGSYSSAEYLEVPLEILNGRPVLRFYIENNEQRLLYDTGSSLFGLWTTRKNWKHLRDRSDKIRSFAIKSWGKVNMGYYSDINQSTNMRTMSFELGSDFKIWYVDNKIFRKFFRKNKLFGILGNQLFLDQEIIIDYRKSIFLIRAM